MLNMPSLDVWRLDDLRELSVGWAKPRQCIGRPTAHDSGAGLARHFLTSQRGLAV